MKKNPISSERGLISVVAIGIFTLLSLFGIIVQQNVMDTFDAVKNMNNYYKARDVADSVLERLQFEMSQAEVGYNTPTVSGSDVDCIYPPAEGTTNHALCSGLDAITGEKPVTVSLRVKSHAEFGAGIDESLATNKCDDASGNCYTVPLPGTGDAGNNCNLYTPNYDSTANMPASIVGVGVTLDQFDYACNWNKLQFGSGSTDRVTIPLHFGDADNEIVNPYITYGTGTADYFAVRMRTPCKPCGDTASGDIRECEAGEDAAICTNLERYELDDFPNDIVAHWQINGVCEGSENCGLRENPSDSSSLLSESNINDSRIAGDSKILVNVTKGLETARDSYGYTILETPPNIGQFVSDTENPLLVLFLGNALISENDNNIPYLEYQIVTDYPVTAPRSEIEATINVDGNIFTKTLFKGVTKELIDFAVQN